MSPAKFTRRLATLTCRFMSSSAPGLMTAGLSDDPIAGVARGRRLSRWLQCAPYQSGPRQWPEPGCRIDRAVWRLRQAFAVHRPARPRLGVEPVDHCCLIGRRRGSRGHRSRPAAGRRRMPRAEISACLHDMREGRQCAPGAAPPAYRRENPSIPSRLRRRALRATVETPRPGCRRPARRSGSIGS